MIRAYRSGCATCDADVHDAARAEREQKTDPVAKTAPPPVSAAVPEPQKAVAFQAPRPLAASRRPSWRP